MHINMNPLRSSPEQESHLTQSILLTTLIFIMYISDGSMQLQKGEKETCKKYIVGI